jgi:hypothetical protein
MGLKFNRGAIVPSNLLHGEPFLTPEANLFVGNSLKNPIPCGATPLVKRIWEFHEYSEVQGNIIQPFNSDIDTLKVNLSIDFNYPVKVYAQTIIGLDGKLHLTSYFYHPLKWFQDLNPTNLYSDIYKYNNFLVFKEPVQFDNIIVEYTPDYQKTLEYLLYNDAQELIGWSADLLSTLNYIIGGHDWNEINWVTTKIIDTFVELGERKVFSYAESLTWLLTDTETGKTYRIPIKLLISGFSEFEPYEPMFKLPFIAFISKPGLYSVKIEYKIGSLTVVSTSQGTFTIL